MVAEPRLAVGPLLYHWSRAQTLAFYERLADAPVAIVYLGETVCAKRRALAPGDWIGLGRALAAAGKEVVLSTLTLIEARSELGAVRRLCGNGEFTVEANDMTAVARLAAAGVPFVGGPALNLYSAESLSVLVRQGLVRWVPPVEMAGADLRRLLSDWSAAMDDAPPETELFALGRLPLAWSARCFTARACGRSKDDCGFVCGEHPAGLPLETREGERFLTLNGVQTQSGQPVDLFPYAAAIAELGIEVLRVSPVPGDFDALLHACRGVLTGTCSASAVRRALGEDTCDGYWHALAGRAKASA